MAEVKQSGDYMIFFLSVNIVFLWCWCKDNQVLVSSKRTRLLLVQVLRAVSFFFEGQKSDLLINWRLIDF